MQDGEPSKFPPIPLRTAPRRRPVYSALRRVRHDRRRADRHVPQRLCRGDQNDEEKDHDKKRALWRQLRPPPRNRPAPFRPVKNSPSPTPTPPPMLGDGLTIRLWRCGSRTPAAPRSEPSRCRSSRVVGDESISTISSAGTTPIRSARSPAASMSRPRYRGGPQTRSVFAGEGSDHHRRRHLEEDAGQQQRTHRHRHRIAHHQAGDIATERAGPGLPRRHQ